jgi:hypothetical protein
MDAFRPVSSLSLGNLTTEERCELAYSFKFQYRLVFLVVLQFLISFATLCLLWLIFKSREIKRIWALITADLKVGFWLRLNGFK